MDTHENDDYIPDEGHLVSGRPRKSKHIEAGGPGGRPGQRGKNKREHGEKPVVTVKWNQQLTEQLWVLIKTKPELKKVLVNEPTRFLGPHGATGQLFSKKDLQRTIAEHLFSDGMYDLSDPVIMDNLTRAVKNKLHKTQMLYEASHKDLPPDFVQYQSEAEIPPSLRPKWAKVKDRFPTYFEYHELAQEIPTITAQMEIDAQKIGAWKAKALSGSEDGSPGSFLSRNRSRSIDTSASWDAPEVESPAVPHQPLLPDEQDFEVLPPPTDGRTALSDIESVGLQGATGLGAISPGLSPVIGPSDGQPLNQPQPGRWSPNVSGPVMPLSLSQPMVVNPIRSASTENVTHQWSSMTDGLSPNGKLHDGGSYDANSVLQGAWTTEPTAMMSSSGSRFPAIPMSSVPQDGGHLTAQNSLQAQESRHSSVGLSNPRKRRKGHERVQSGGGASNGEFPPDSMASPQAMSPYSAGYTSTSGSPDMLMDPDSPKDDRTMEQLLQILRDRETRRTRRQEEWLRLKQKKLEDRERQRQENQRQREENERQRKHEASMMEQKIHLAQLELQRKHYQSDSMRSGSIPTNGSGMTSPDHHDSLGIGGFPHEAQPHDIQYPDNLMMFAPIGSGQSSYDQHPLSMMGMSGPSHTPVPLQQQQQQQQQKQQKQRMLGMGQFQQSPINGPTSGDGMGLHMGQGFGQEGYHDPQLDDLLNGGIHAHSG